MQTNSEIQRRIDRGKAFFATGEFVAARAEFSEAIDADPKNISALLLRGDACRISIDDLGSAVQDYTASLLISSGDVHARLGRAISHAVLGHVEIGMPDIEAAMSSGVSAAREYLEMSRPHIEAVAGKPFADCFAYAATAEELCERLIVRARGISLLEQRAARDLAICDWSIAIALRPADSVPIRGRAISWQTRKSPAVDFDDLSRGANDYLKNAELRSTDQNLFDAAFALYEATRDVEGLQIVEGLIQRQPRKPEYWSLRGAIFAEMHDWERASRDIDMAIGLWEAIPGSKQSLANAYYSRGRASHCLGDFERAVASFTECLRRNPSFYRMEVLIARGQSLGSLRDYERALADFNAAVELFSDTRRVSAYIARGDFYLEIRRVRIQD